MAKKTTTCATTIKTSEGESPRIEDSTETVLRLIDEVMGHHAEKKIEEGTTAGVTHKAALPRIQDLTGAMLSAIDQLPNHPDNQDLKDILRAGMHFITQLADRQDLNRHRAQVDHVVKSLGDLERILFLLSSGGTLTAAITTILTRAKREIRKTLREKPGKQQSPKNAKTVRLYLELLKHNTQKAALNALVELPSERDEDYAKEYRADHDYESLRNKIRSLVRTYNKARKKKRTPHFVLVEIRRIEDSLEEFKRLSSPLKKGS